VAVWSIYRVGVKMEMEDGDGVIRYLPLYTRFTYIQRFRGVYFYVQKLIWDWVIIMNHDYHYVNEM